MTAQRHIWGITGGMGSGKSTVAGLLAQRGACVVDADALAKTLTAPGGVAIAALLAQWGPAVLDASGAMDRNAMRQRILEQPQDKARLESILHPLIAQSIDRAIDQSQRDWVLCDLPLLVESPRWRQRLAGVWLVDCSEETQIQRVQQRSQWPLPTIRAMLAQQASRAQRLRCADVVTYNEGCSLDQLSRLVAAQAESMGLR